MALNVQGKPAERPWREQDDQTKGRVAALFRSILRREPVREALLYTRASSSAQPDAQPADNTAETTIKYSGIRDLVDEDCASGASGRKDKQAQIDDEQPAAPDFRVFNYGTVNRKVTRTVATSRAELDTLTSLPQPFDLLHYDATRLSLGMDVLVRPQWLNEAKHDTSTTADRSSVAVLNGPMPPSKAQYIARARFRGFQRTSTREHNALVNKAMIPLMMILLALWLSFWSYYGWMPFVITDPLDNNAAPAAVESAANVFMIVIAVVALGCMYGLSTARWLFCYWHLRTYGDDDTRLLPTAKRWMYAFFYIPAHRPQWDETKRFGYLLAIIWLMPLIFLIVAVSPQPAGEATTTTWSSFSR